MYSFKEIRLRNIRIRRCLLTNKICHTNNQLHRNYVLIKTTKQNILPKQSIRLRRFNNRTNQPHNYGR